MWDIQTVHPSRWKEKMIGKPVSLAGRKMALAGLSTLAVIVALGTPLAPLPIAGSAALAAVGDPLTSYADIVSADKPAVVTVTTEIARPVSQMDQNGQQGVPPDEFFRRFFGENGPFPGFPGMPGGGQGQGPEQAPHGRALGSGFIVSADGYVVTNNHVIEGATKITVKLDDGRDLPATLVGTDAKSDIAVLKVDAGGDLPIIAWGDSDALQTGDPVLAIGDPFGIGTTVTAGIVSARGRDLHSGPYDDFVQVDAAINHGNSGRPLVDATGQVVGINTAIYSPNGGNVGVGFAIPAAHAEKVVAQIIEHGTIEHGFIGVSIQPVDAEIAGAIGLDKAAGALVAAVQDASPAFKAGIQVGDVVLKVNGGDVATPKDLSRAIADLAPGEKADLVVLRGGDETDVSITVGKMDADEVASAAMPGDSGAGVAVADLGLSLQTLTPTDSQALGLPEDTQGAIVSRVEPGGEAADKGIQQGDVILSVNQASVASAEDVATAIEKARNKHRDAALLLIARGQERSFVAVPFHVG